MSKNSIAFLKVNVQYTMKNISPIVSHIIVIFSKYAFSQT